MLLLNRDRPCHDPLDSVSASLSPRNGINFNFVFCRGEDRYTSGRPETGGVRANSESSRGTLPPQPHSTPWYHFCIEAYPNSICGGHLVAIMH